MVFLKKFPPKKVPPVGNFQFQGLLGGKAMFGPFFGLVFFCSPSRILPIGSLRGPKVSKKNFPKKNFPPAGDFQFQGFLGGKAMFGPLFGLVFFCSPSGILPIGSLRGPMVFTKKFPQKNFPPGGNIYIMRLYGEKAFSEDFFGLFFFAHHLGSFQQGP